MTTDARCLALVDVDADTVRALLAPVLCGAEIRSVVRVDGGLVLRLVTEPVNDTY